MSEVLGQPVETGEEAQAFGPPVSAGTLLRQARENAGLHVSSLAVALKVPARKLEALEDDRYDELPDAVFVRALASSVCRNLKIDPAPVLQRLPSTGAPRLAVSGGGINAPFRSPRDAVGPAWKEQLSRPVSLAVFALLLGALVLVLLPARQQPQVAATPEAAPGEITFQPAPSDPVVPAGASPAALISSGALVLPPTGRADPLAAATMAPAAGATPVAGRAEAVTAAGPAAAAPATAASAPIPQGLVVFTAKGESWIQVTDARGGVPLRRLLTAGESVAASGPLPLTVTVGSASATDVMVRGKPYDLAPVVRDNVARFEVK